YSPKNFRSMLEYLLFRAGFFNLEKKNLCEFTICDHHFKYLTAANPQDNCKVCKVVRQRPTIGTSSLRLVLKSMALRIWEAGQPNNTWAFFDQFICCSCRHYFQEPDDVKDSISKSETIFDWIYDQDIVYLPVPSEPASQHSIFEPHNFFRYNSQSIF
ncbi:unnamed protein product, partial [Rotaria sordida]